MQVVCHKRRQVGGKLDEQLRLVPWGRQSEFAASRNKLFYEFAAYVLALACPAGNRSNERASMPTHHLHGVFVTYLALLENSAQIRVIYVRKVLGIELALSTVILFKGPTRT